MKNHQKISRTPTSDNLEELITVEAKPNHEQLKSWELKQLQLTFKTIIDSVNYYNPDDINNKFQQLWNMKSDSEITAFEKKLITDQLTLLQKSVLDLLITTAEKYQDTNSPQQAIDYLSKNSELSIINQQVIEGNRFSVFVKSFSKTAMRNIIDQKIDELMKVRLQLN